VIHSELKQNPENAPKCSEEMIEGFERTLAETLPFIGKIMHP